MLRSAHALKPDDSITNPGGMAYTLAQASSDLSLLAITLPANLETTQRARGGSIRLARLR